MSGVAIALIKRFVESGLIKAIETREAVRADEALFLSKVQQVFEREVSFPEGVALARKSEDSLLRNWADWFETPRGKHMSDADEYREASKAYNRAALEAQNHPTVDRLFAWFLAWCRLERAQQVYPLSKPVEQIKRNKRVKAAAPLQPGDFSPEAQAAIVEASVDERGNGIAELENLVVRGMDPDGYVAAILLKVADGHWHHLNVLATAIKRLWAEEGGIPATAGKGQGGSIQLAPEQVDCSSSGTATQVDPTSELMEQPLTSNIMSSADPTVGEAIAVLENWVNTHANWVLPKFRCENGRWLFTESIRKDDYREAYEIAGQSQQFQAFLRKRLGPCEGGTAN